MKITIDRFRNLYFHPSDFGVYVNDHTTPYNQIDFLDWYTRGYESKTKSISIKK